MFGNHCVKTYRQMQDKIALSSAESEFYRILKATATGLGIEGLMEDLGVGVDAEVREPSLQDRVAKGELKIVKVKSRRTWPTP